VIAALALALLPSAAVAGPPPEPVFVPHPDDTGKRVELYVVTPPGDGPFPAIVYVHGHQGGSRPGARAMAESGGLAASASRGRVAVAVSLPGYGRSDGPPDYCGPFSQGAVAAAIAHVRSLRSVDPRRVAVEGVSRGAITAAMVATRDQDLAALVLVVGMYDLERAVDRLRAAEESTPEVRGIAHNIVTESGGTAEAYRARSALRHAERIRTPTLILAGAKDPRDPDGAEARELARRIQAAGGRAEAVVFEPHGHSIPMGDRLGAIVPFLGKTLHGPTPAASPSAGGPLAVAPTASALLALERQAHEAYLKGDAAFFEGSLNDRFVMLGPGGERLDKTATTAMIAGLRCDVKDGWILDEPHLSSIDADTFVLSYRGTFDGTCSVDGRSATIPSPVRAATVWTRSGETWRAAFHGENPILDPRAAAAPAAGPAATKGATTGADTTAGARPANVAADPSTEAMVAVEAAVWEAWKERDARRLHELTARDLAFVDIFGNVTSGRAATLAFWTGHQCDVRSTRVADGRVTSLSPTVGILTFKGILEGTCGGQAFPLIHGTSVYTKEGDAWKLAFTLNHLVH
jgi:pimeloyl-ACP methyl ester carboxylesterase/ketosteroid isomerase-like protein